MQDKLFDMLFKEQDVTWQNIIFEAVKSEEMNPWDIDISALAKRFLDMVKQLKEMDFKISGKIILAAAILLRLKSNKLLTDDLSELDRLIAMGEQGEDGFYDELEEQFLEKGRVITDEEKFKLIPRTPQPRKRKVSVYDLIEALQQALEVRKRRVKRYEDMEEVTMEIPKRGVDITDIIGAVYGQILNHFFSKRVEKLTFSQLLPSDTKKDKIYTFIPLLHLTNQQKIDLQQEYHLAEIDIYMPKGKVIDPTKIKEEIETIKSEYKANIEKEEGNSALFKEELDKTKKTKKETKVKKFKKTEEKKAEDKEEKRDIKKKKVIDDNNNEEENNLKEEVENEINIENIEKDEEINN
ncbi:segregation/condensation protein A [Candidatus Woesearchaeota archaeon]|nr:segregation/condensation protein A [Candidatus Woesearchaeota archaeon]